jgi:hypothetical protein
MTLGLTSKGTVRLTQSAYLVDNADYTSSSPMTLSMSAVVTGGGSMTTVGAYQ